MVSWIFSAPVLSTLDSSLESVSRDCWWDGLCFTGSSKFLISEGAVPAIIGLRWSCSSQVSVSVCIWESSLIVVVRVRHCELWEFASAEVGIAWMVRTKFLRNKLVENSMKLFLVLLDHVKTQVRELSLSVPLSVELLLPLSGWLDVELVQSMAFSSHDSVEHVGLSMFFWFWSKSAESFNPLNQACVWSDEIRKLISGSDSDNSDVFVFLSCSFIGIHVCKQCWWFGNVIAWDVQISTNCSWLEIVRGCCASQCHLS